MTAPSGAFFSSLDADSEHVEGRFYVWTAAEIADVLGPDDAALFGRFYDVSPDGNWHDEETGAPVTILNRLRAPAPTTEVAARLHRMRDKLLARRATRVRPGLDDKILCDWNALAVTALVHAGVLLDQPDWIERAVRAFAALVDAGETAFGPGSLVHSHREGQMGPVAFASDYVGMARAALALHEAKPGEGYLAPARNWLEAAAARFAGDDGVLFMADAAASDIPTRLAPLHDEAVPNPNGLYVACLLRLAAMTGDDRHQDRRRPPASRRPERNGVASTGALRPVQRLRLAAQRRRNRAGGRQHGAASRGRAGHELPKPDHRDRVRPAA